MGTLEDRRAMVLPEDSDQRRLTETFRAQVCEHARSGGFLGPEVGAILTTEFDRVVHGVDCVLELRHADGTANHLAVSFEVTAFGQKPWDPFDQIRAELERDELAPVKHFHSEWLDYKGGLRAPRVHLAFPESRHPIELSLWEAGIGRMVGSATHRILLRTMAYQLVCFERFAAVRRRDAALEHLQQTRIDFARRLDAIGFREDLEAEDLNPGDGHVVSRLCEVFSDVLEGWTGASSAD